MIVHFFTPFNFLEDRVNFIRVVYHLCREEDHAREREVGFEKIWQVSS